MLRCACGKLVDKSDMEAHQKEYHEKVKCQYCSVTKEKKDMEDHEKSCNMKPKKCVYCDLDLLPKEYDAHVTNCGGKTQKCETCGKFITTRDWEVHAYNCADEMKARDEYEKFAKEEKERKEAELRARALKEVLDKKYAHNTKANAAKQYAPPKNVVPKIPAQPKSHINTVPKHSPPKAAQPKNVNKIQIPKPITKAKTDIAKMDEEFAR